MAKTSEAFDVSVTTDVTTTEAIDLRDWDGGSYTIANGEATTSLTWWASSDGTTYEAAYSDGVAVTQTVAADQGHEIPAGLNGRAYLKIVGDSAGTLSMILKRMNI